MRRSDVQEDSFLDNLVSIYVPLEGRQNFSGGAHQLFLLDKDGEFCIS